MEKEDPNAATLGVLTEIRDLMKNLARDQQTIKSNLLSVINYMHDAESEVPEKMRRFIMYFHDVHDLTSFYHEMGQQSPPWINREAERCADRFRHLVEDLEKPGETFEKVRREMASRPNNRYDHTKLLDQETPNAR
jgi:hypoxanthine-guanine phosphoribosyltransferase